MGYPFDSGWWLTDNLEGLHPAQGDDGAVFFEGESCVADLGLRKATLGPAELAELKALAQPKCAEIFRPTKEGSSVAMCTHIDDAMATRSLAPRVKPPGWGGSPGTGR